MKKGGPLRRKTPLVARSTLKTKKGFKKPDVATLLKSGLVTTASSLKTKKPMRKRAKDAEFWWDVALEIWEQRPHECAVCLCSLGDEPNPSFFSHALPRSTYPDFKREPANIDLLCAFHHDEWHAFGDKDKLLAHDPRWELLVWKYRELRKLANE